MPDSDRLWGNPVTGASAVQGEPHQLRHVNQFTDSSSVAKVAQDGHLIKLGAMHGLCCVIPFDVKILIVFHTTEYDK